MNKSIIRLFFGGVKGKERGGQKLEDGRLKAESLRKKSIDSAVPGSGPRQACHRMINNL
jgi:hypothetical protein